MKFQKGNKFSPGGKIGNRGGGRKSKFTKEVEAAGEEYARKYLLTKARVQPVLRAYSQLAAGKTKKFVDAETGEIVHLQIDPDPSTTRHYVDKLVPPKEKVDVDLIGSVEIFTNVNPDLGPPRKK